MRAEYVPSGHHDARRTWRRLHGGYLRSAHRPARVCLATLGPGLINLMLGIAKRPSRLPSAGGDHRAGRPASLYKESHQAVDLVELFRPITEMGRHITVDEAAPRWFEKAFQAGADRTPGARS